MSNTRKGGMPAEKKKQYIIEALEGVSADILDLIYRIIFCAESGLE